MLSGVLNLLFFEKYLTNFFFIILFINAKNKNNNYKNISKLKCTVPYHQR